MSAARHQTLRMLDGSYVLDRPADVTDVDLRADVLAVVFGPDGSTVMRRNDAGEDAWSALWNGDEAHDVQATGMLSAIVAPLGAAGVPVWVVSGFDGDLVLVPADRLDEASGVLQAAGHSPAVNDRQSHRAPAPGNAPPGAPDLAGQRGRPGA